VEEREVEFVFSTVDGDLNCKDAKVMEGRGKKRRED
jgi:hypothetical protein